MALATILPVVKALTTKKRVNRASADVGLMYVAYNLRRLMNIIGKDLFKKFLTELVLLFFTSGTLLKIFSAIKKHRLFTKMNIMQISKAA